MKNIQKDMWKRFDFENQIEQLEIRVKILNLCLGKKPKAEGKDQFRKQIKNHYKKSQKKMFKNELQIYPNYMKKVHTFPKMTNKANHSLI